MDFVINEAFGHAFVFYLPARQHWSRFDRNLEIYPLQAPSALLLSTYRGKMAVVSNSVRIDKHNSSRCSLPQPRFRLLVISINKDTLIPTPCTLNRLL